MRVERHKSGVWVREDGCVYLPQSGKHPAHWTYGSRQGNGYLSVRINGRCCYVHRLAAEAYFWDIPEGYEIDHRNRNRSDNRLENIRIVSRSDNQRNTSRNDHIDARGGTHWYEDSKRYYRERSARHRKLNPEKCREYHRAYQRKRYASDPEYAEHVRAYQRERYAKRKALRLAAKEN